MYICIVLKQAMIIRSVLWVLRRNFKKLDPTQGHATIVTYLTSRSGRDISDKGDFRNHFYEMRL